VIIKPDITT